jgi:hypothetical protein
MSASVCDFTFLQGVKVVDFTRAGRCASTARPRA